MGRKAAGFVGSMWLVTWLFAVVGGHTPMSLAVALVGCTAFGLLFAVASDVLSSKKP